MIFQVYFFFFFLFRYIIIEIFIFEKIFYQVSKNGIASVLKHAHHQTSVKNVFKLDSVTKFRCMVASWSVYLASRTMFIAIILCLIILRPKSELYKHLKLRSIMCKTRMNSKKQLITFHNDNCLFLVFSTSISIFVLQIIELVSSKLLILN